MGVQEDCLPKITSFPHKVSKELDTRCNLEDIYVRPRRPPPSRDGLPLQRQTAIICENILKALTPHSKPLTCSPLGQNMVPEENCQRPTESLAINCGHLGILALDSDMLVVSAATPMEKFHMHVDAKKAKLFLMH